MLLVTAQDCMGKREHTESSERVDVDSQVKNDSRQMHDYSRISTPAYYQL